MSAEAADELGLEPGVLAIASVKSTNVVVELPMRTRHRAPCPVVLLLAGLLAGCGSSVSGSGGGGGSTAAAAPDAAPSPCSPPRR